MRSMRDGADRNAGGGDIFELRPSTPYSKDYKTVESQGKEEVETGYQPPLAAKVENTCVVRCDFRRYADLVVHDCAAGRYVFSGIRSGG